MPQSTRLQVSQVVQELSPQRRWSVSELRGWLHETEARNAAAKRSHAKRRASQYASLNSS